MNKLWDEGGNVGDIPIRHLDSDKDYVHLY